MRVSENAIRPPTPAALWVAMVKSSRPLTDVRHPNQEFTAPLVRLNVSESPSDYVVLIAADPVQATPYYLMRSSAKLAIEYRYRTHEGYSAGGFGDSELVQVKREIRFPTHVRRKTCRLRWTPEGSFSISRKPPELMMSPGPIRRDSKSCRVRAHCKWMTLEPRSACVLLGRCSEIAQPLSHNAQQRRRIPAK
jgi:hypothetical protein